MNLPRDTTQESYRVMTEMYQRMTPHEKLKRIFSAYETGKMLAFAGLKRLHPDASEAEIWHRWAEQSLGRTLYRQVYGTADYE